MKLPEAPPLSRRQTVILMQMAENADNDDGEIVFEHGHGFLGYDQISRKTIIALLRACAISLDPFSKVGGFERYTINETGRELLQKLGKISNRTVDA
jgi:hypothetical protein